MASLPKLIIFASGSKVGGGSGFEKLVEARNAGALVADIVAVASNHEFGGVREKADRLGIPFHHFPGPYTREEYQRIVKIYEGEWVALSGWLKLVSGLDPRTTFNIHPGPLPEFGGKGMYGHHVHKAVVDARRRFSEVTMHFVTSEYDEGPVFFRHSVEVLPDDNADTLGKRVNNVEHEWQARITNEVIHGRISWDGKDLRTLVGARFYNQYSVLKP